MMRPTGIPVEAFGNMNSIFVLTLVPSLVVFYKVLERNNIRFTILQRMGTGFTLMSIAYAISGVLVSYSNNSKYS
jgi:dipeptide/tripeptide permease